MENKQVKLTFMVTMLRYTELGLREDVANIIAYILGEYLDDEIKKDAKTDEGIVLYRVFEKVLIEKDKMLMNVNLDSFPKSIQPKVIELLDVITNKGFSEALNYLKKYTIERVGKEELDNFFNIVEKELVDNLLLYLQKNKEKINGKMTVDKVIIDFKASHYYKKELF